MDFGEHSSTINIYDVSNDTWSVSYLEQPKGSMAGIAVGNKNYWAGGKIPETATHSYMTSEVEIRDANSATSIKKCLFQPNAGYSTNFEAVLKNNKIIFFTGWGSLKNKFDIYDITTDTWAIGVINQSLNWACPVSVNNTIYVAAADINGSLSNQVWKLEF